MTTSSKQIGNTGEDLACDYYTNTLNYKIINRNYKCGKFGEIDIVAFKNNSYMFIEVKTRASDKFMDLFDVVNYRKMEALKKAAQYYILKFKIQRYSHRIDLLTINNYTNEIEYFENITSPY